MSNTNVLDFDLTILNVTSSSEFNVSLLPAIMQIMAQTLKEQMFTCNRIRNQTSYMSTENVKARLQAEWWIWEKESEHVWPEFSASLILPQHRYILHCLLTFSFTAQWNTNIKKPAKTEASFKGHSKSCSQCAAQRHKTYCFWIQTPLSFPLGVS